MRQDFAEYVTAHIRDYLPQDYREAKITLEKVTKGNDRTLTGLTILKDGEHITPTIYLEPYAMQNENGRPMDDILREIAAVKMENSRSMPFDVEKLKDYETVRPLLSIRLCDPERNREYLKDKPYTMCSQAGIRGSVRQLDFVFVLSRAISVRHHKFRRFWSVLQGWHKGV